MNVPENFLHGKQTHTHKLERIVAWLAAIRAKSCRTFVYCRAHLCIPHTHRHTRTLAAEAEEITAKTTAAKHNQACSAMQESRNLSRKVWSLIFGLTSRMGGGSVGIWVWTICRSSSALLVLGIFICPVYSSQHLRKSVVVWKANMLCLISVLGSSCCWTTQVVLKWGEKLLLLLLRVFRNEIKELFAWMVNHWTQFGLKKYWLLVQEELCNTRSLLKASPRFK